jgi:hypothetical protein
MRQRTRLPRWNVRLPRRDEVLRRRVHLQCSLLPTVPRRPDLSERDLRLSLYRLPHGTMPTRLRLRQHRGRSLLLQLRRGV